MPGPTDVGLSRSPAVRALLATLLVTSLLAADTATALAFRPAAAPTTVPPDQRPAPDAASQMIPAPAATGVATCTDPAALQEWRVSWRAISTTDVNPTPTPSAPSKAEIAAGSVIARAAGSSIPTAAATPIDEATPVVPADPTSSPSAESPVGPTSNPSPTGDPSSELATRAAAVTLIPTGFAVRSLAAASQGRTATPTPTATTSTAPNPETPKPAAPNLAAPNLAAPNLTTPKLTTPKLTTPNLTTPNPTTPNPTPANPTPANPTPSNPTAATSVRPSPTPADGWQSRDDDTWLLRWSPTVPETVNAPKNEKWVRTGPLATLAANSRSVQQDPRYVTPDGACSVYLAPFLSGTPQARNRVAVIGDSLVAQLYASEDGTATGTGWLMNRLLAAGDRAEIAGQGGRRWTIKPGVPSALDAADASMLDEIRGLREARSVVIALGTNDAGWVALAKNQGQYELRLAWVLMHLASILDELRDHGHCTVLATMATRNKRYLDSAVGRFDAAATTINNYLRQRVDADPNHRLRLWDWGTHADAHGTADPQPWFGADTIHLNAAGHGRYADELATAATGC